jgi:hypothetical protein
MLRISPCEGAAQSGAVSAGCASPDPDLARLIDAWSKLDPHVKTAILALAASYKFLLGTDGVVRDEMAEKLDLLETAFRHLIAPQARLQGGMSEERRREVVQEFARNSNLPANP